MGFLVYDFQTQGNITRRMQCIVGSLRSLYMCHQWVYTKLCVLIAKLEIKIWHCSGKIYIYIQYPTKVLGHPGFFHFLGLEFI